MQHTDLSNPFSTDCTLKHMHLHTSRLRLKRKKVYFNNLHSKWFNIKRLIPYSCVTFCLLNIHHPGFGEPNFPYEYEVIEKYVSNFQSWLISQRIQILTHKKIEPKTETMVLIKKAFFAYSALWLIVMSLWM